MRATIYLFIGMQRKFLTTGFIFILVSCVSLGNGYCIEIERLSLPSIPDLTRTDIYYIKPDYKPIACLVMCPGIDGNGEHYLRRPDLLAFAKQYKVALVALSFASSLDVLQDEKGYYIASQGAGNLLLKGIDDHIAIGVPLLLYGFSGGAHFVSSFEESYPERTMAWCAYTANSWKAPKTNRSNPPGIIACGKLDVERYEATFQYFQKGRKLGKPWCWVALGNTDHAENESLNAFTIAYFEAILNNGSSPGGWFDINTTNKLSLNEITKPENTAWLPSNYVHQMWCKLHNP